MAGEILTVEVKGLDELQEKLEALPYKVAKRGLKSTLYRAADIVKKAMMALAPKDTHFLEEHFNIKVGQPRGAVNADALAMYAYIGPQGKIDYPAYASGAYKIKRTKTGKARKVGRIAVATVARFLEFGTSKMAKKPFMTAAYESTKGAALTKIQEGLTEAVKDVS
jgi:HK97 gp10 family phage protein